MYVWSKLSFKKKPQRPQPSSTRPEFGPAEIIKVPIVGSSPTESEIKTTSPDVPHRTSIVAADLKQLDQAVLSPAHNNSVKEPTKEIDEIGLLRERERDLDKAFTQPPIAELPQEPTTSVFTTPERAQDLLALQPLPEVALPERVKIFGDLYLPEGGEIRGTHTGSLNSRKLLVATDGCQMNSTISGTDIAVFGTVHGRISMTGKVELHPQSTIVGSVECSKISIRKGAKIKAHLLTTGAIENRHDVEHEAEKIAHGEY